MALEMAQAIVRVRIDRNKLRSEIAAARRQIQRGLADIVVRVRVDTASAVNTGRAAGAAAGRAASASFQQAFRGGFTSSGTGIIPSARPFVNTGGPPPAGFLPPPMIGTGIIPSARPFVNTGGPPPAGFLPPPMIGTTSFTRPGGGGGTAQVLGGPAGPAGFLGGPPGSRSAGARGFGGGRAFFGGGGGIPPMRGGNFAGFRGGGGGGGGGGRPRGPGTIGFGFGRSPLGNFAAGFGFQTAPMFTTAAFFGGPTGALGAGTALGGGAAFREFADFEEAFRRVETIQRQRGSAPEDIESLNQQARDLGRSTVFSATEVARAMVILTQQGQSAADIYRTLPNILNLAIVGQLDIARATEIVTSVQNQFGLQSKDTEEIVDTLTRGFVGSKATIEDFGTALAIVGPIAKSSGLSLQDAVVAISALRDKGQQASTAGAGLRRVLVDLNDPDVQNTFRQLGVEVVDAGGRMKDFEEIVRDTNRALSGATPTERTGFATGIFEQRGGTSFVALLDTGAELLGEYRAGLDNAAVSSEKFAEEQLENLKQKTILLNDALKDLGVELGLAFSDEAKLVIDELAESIRNLGEAVDDPRLDNPAILKILNPATAFSPFNALFNKGRALVEDRFFPPEATTGSLFPPGAQERRPPFVGPPFVPFTGPPHIRRLPSSTPRNPFAPPESGVGFGAARNRQISTNARLAALGELAATPAEVAGEQQVATQRAFQSRSVGIEDLSRQIQLGVLNKKDPQLEEIKKNTKATVDAIKEQGGGGTFQ
jgi:TP901 family phage tail tape measure protein